MHSISIFIILFKIKVHVKSNSERRRIKFIALRMPRNSRDFIEGKLYNYTIVNSSHYSLNKNQI